MRWALIIAAGTLIAGVWLPGYAADGDVPLAARNSVSGPDTITFEQYREWRLRWNDRRTAEITRELAVPGLPQSRKDRLIQAKAYYDGLAGLPDAERNRRFRERFDRIDRDHDGTIDRAERAAWRETRSALYRRAGDTARKPAALGER